MPRAKKDANATSTPKKTSTRAKKASVDATGAAAAPAPALETAVEIRSTTIVTKASPESVQQRAYQLYLERGAGHGNDLEDWFRAEAELKQKSA